MPELRRGVRRGRAGLTPQNRQPDPPRVQNCVKTRAAVARERKRPLTRLETKRLKEKQEDNKVIVISEKEDSEFLISERKKKGKKNLAVVSVKEKQEEDVKRVGIMGDDSGGLSANKAVGQEEEGNTAPFPEKVCYFC